MLPIIQSLWIGGPLSQVEKLCIKSFMDHGHDFHLYVYDYVEGIPEGAVVKEGNEIVPANIISEFGKEIAQFSDLFRYTLLEKNGNYWVDMDVICIKPFDFTEQIVFGLGRLRTPMGVLKFPKRHNLMTVMKEACSDYTRACPWDDEDDKIRKEKNRRQKKKYFLTPYFHKAIYYYELEQYGKPYMCFYSSHHKTWRYCFDNSYANKKLSNSIYSLHLFNSEMNALPGFDKNATFAKGSLIEQLKRKHAIAPHPMTASRFTHDEVNKLFRDVEKVKSLKKKAKIYFAVFVCILLGFLTGLLF